MANTNKEVFQQIKGVAFNNLPIKDFAEAGRLISAGVAPKVMTLSVDGWDFHANLRQAFVGNESPGAGLGGRFAVSLKALVDELKSAGKWNSTTIVIMTEFGRRIAQNGSFGNDHGRGSAAMVLGGGLRNGGRFIMKNNLPQRLVNLYKSSDPSTLAQASIPVDYDYRVLLTEIFEKRFGVAAQASVTDIFKEDSIDGLGSIRALA